MPEKTAAEWKRIEDAPMDGTRIIGLTVDGYEDLVYWAEHGS